MNEQLEHICYEFLEWRDELRETRTFASYRQLYPLCAYICQIRHQEPNYEIFNLCREIVHEYAGFFSMFRGNAETVLITLLSCESDPGACMELSYRAYNSLKGEFGASHYLPVLAYHMATTMPEKNYDRFTYQTRDLFNLFNHMHPLLTSNEDTIFMGLLNATGRDHDVICREAEEIYDMLAPEFAFHKNAVHTLSHALTLCPGEPGAKAARFRNLFRRLREDGYKYGKDYEIVPLGLLANMGFETDQIMNDFVEVEDYLYNSDGYGGVFGFSRRTRFLHTILILSVYYHNGSSEVTAAMIVAVLMEIQAEQQAAAAAAA